jgi:2-iminobutanoate/2-iminopropanoate deaminase
MVGHKEKIHFCFLLRKGCCNCIAISIAHWYIRQIVNEAGFKLMKRISPVPDSAYSRAVTAELGTLLFISGQESIDESGKLIAPGDFSGQFQQVWKNLQRALDKAQGELEQVATMTVYTTERRWGREFTGGRKEIFTNGFPASAFVEVRKLRTPGALLQIPAIAVLEERQSTMSDSRERKFIDPLPQLGQSRAVKVRGGTMVFLAGHTAGEMTHESEMFNFTGQTIRTFERIKASVETAGGQLSDIVSMSVFMTDMRHVSEFQSVLRELFGDNLPASSYVEVTHLARPELLLEIQPIAVVA